MMSFYENRVKYFKQKTVTKTLMIYIQRRPHSSLLHLKMFAGKMAAPQLPVNFDLCFERGGVGLVFFLLGNASGAFLSFHKVTRAAAQWIASSKTGRGKLPICRFKCICMFYDLSCLPLLFGFTSQFLPWCPLPQQIPSPNDIYTHKVEA